MWRSSCGPSTCRCHVEPCIHTCIYKLQICMYIYVCVFVCLGVVLRTSGDSVPRISWYLASKSHRSHLGMFFMFRDKVDIRWGEEEKPSKIDWLLWERQKTGASNVRTCFAHLCTVVYPLPPTVCAKLKLWLFCWYYATLLDFTELRILDY